MRFFSRAFVFLWRAADVSDYLKRGKKSAKKYPSEAWR
jgi:hypothetical protein